MKFTQTSLAGAYVIDIEPHRDARGFFGRSFCVNELAQQGLKNKIAQTSVCGNIKKGTVRGMHFQLPPHTETKFVRVTAGAIYDVIIDLRPESPTYMQWTGVELTAENRRTLYVPDGFGHGYQTLTDDVQILYMITEFYLAGHAYGVRYDDPAFNIQWPTPVAVISDADLNWPKYEKP